MKKYICLKHEIPNSLLKKINKNSSFFEISKNELLKMFPKEEFLNDKYKVFPVFSDKNSLEAIIILDHNSNLYPNNFNYNKSKYFTLIKPYIEIITKLKQELENEKKSFNVTLEEMLNLMEELSTLYELSKLMSKELVTFYDINEFINEVFNFIKSVFQINNALIVLVSNKNPNEITNLACLDKNTSPEILFESIRTFHDFALSKNHSILYPEEKENLLKNTSSDLTSFIIHPLISPEGQKLGTLTIFGNKNLGERTRNFLSVIGRQITLILSLGITFKELIKKKKLEQELELASEIHRNLLPDNHPFIMGWDIYGWLHTAKIVGGDYYDYFIDRQKNILTIVIADVSGKGISAALIMGSFRGSLRSIYKSSVKLNNIINKLNKILKKDVKGEKFVTLFIIKINLTTGKAVFIKAGHNPPIFIDRNNNTQKIEANGLFLGMFEDIMIEEKKILFKKNSGLFLYTDGAIELTNNNNEEYGLLKLEHDLKIIFNKYDSINVVKKIINNLKAFKKNLDWFDDVTLISIKRIPFKTLEYNISSNLSLIRKISFEIIEKVSSDIKIINKSDKQYMRLILDELLTNAIEHGNNNNPDLNVNIKVEYDNRGIFFHIKDEGNGFNWKQEMKEAKIINLFKIRGRGLLICINLSKEFYYNSIGNIAHIGIYWSEYEKHISS